MVTRTHRQGVGFGGGQPRFEVAVNQQSPDLLVGDKTDQALDVHAAITQRTALFVGLGDLGFEGNDPF